MAVKPIQVKNVMEENRASRDEMAELRKALATNTANQETLQETLQEIKIITGPRYLNEHVKQILINELGLNRDYVRGMAEDILEAVIKRRVADVLEGRLDTLVTRAVERIVTATFSKEETKRLVEAAVKVELERSFQINITPKTKKD